MTNVNSRIEEAHGTPLHWGDSLYFKRGRHMHINFMYNILSTEKHGGRREVENTHILQGVNVLIFVV